MSVTPPNSGSSTISTGSSKILLGEDQPSSKSIEDTQTDLLTAESQSSAIEKAAAVAKTIKARPGRKLVGVLGLSADPVTIGHRLAIQDIAQCYKHPVGEKKGSPSSAPWTSSWCCPCTNIIFRRSGA